MRFNILGNTIMRINLNDVNKLNRKAENCTFLITFSKNSLSLNLLDAAKDDLRAFAENRIKIKISCIYNRINNFSFIII